MERGHHKKVRTGEGLPASEHEKRGREAGSYREGARPTRDEDWDTHCKSCGRWVGLVDTAEAVGPHHDCKLLVWRQALPQPQRCHTLAGNLSAHPQPSHVFFCRSPEDATQLLLCEGCPAVVHMFCMDPPLEKVPAGDWFCHKCVKKKSLADVERVVDVRVLPDNGRRSGGCAWEHNLACCGGV